MPFSYRRCATRARAGYRRALLAGSAVGLALSGAVAGTAKAQSTQPSPGTVELPPVSVEADRTGSGGAVGYKADQPSLPKLTGPLRDTPQSITVVPRELLDDRGVTSVSDALRNVPGISLAAGEAGAQGNNLTLRGFTARNDIFLDGMRDFGSYYRDPFNLDAIEALKGPSSILFGRGSTGGVINQVSKSPLLSPFVAGTVTFGTDDTKRATVDVNQPLPALGSGTAVRLNAMGHESQVADRDVGEYRRFGVAPSLALGLGTPTRLTLSYFHQSEDNIPDYGIPFLFGRPAPVARNNYYGFTDGNYLRTDADIGTVRLEHDLSDAVTIRNQFRYAEYSRRARITEAQIPGAVTPATPLGAINVTRNQIAIDSTETFLNNQLDVTARFSTGFIRHTLVAGVEAGRETSDPTRRTFSGVPVTSLLAPNPDQPFAGTSTVSSRVNTRATSVGVYAIDTLKLGEQWEVTGGIRYDRFDVDYKQSVVPASSFSRVDEKPSWRASVTYKPLPNGSVYVAYGTSFNPSAEALSLSAATANLAPEENETYEVGSKWDLFAERLSIRGAVFRSEKTNARVTDPNNPLLNTLGGNQRADGFELEATGRLTERWQVFAGYAYQDAEVTKSSPLPTSPQPGVALTNAPKHTFNLFTTYELPWGFQVGGGLNYVSGRVARNTPPISTVPGYWTVDALVKYHLAEHVDLQLNLFNLFDEYYIDQVHPAHIVPGAGRTALITTSFRF